MKCVVNDFKLSVCNVYAPNIEKDHYAFVELLATKMWQFLEVDDTNLIIGGDWNFVTDITLDRDGGNPHHRFLIVGNNAWVELPEACTHCNKPKCH